MKTRIPATSFCLACVCAFAAITVAPKAFAWPPLDKAVDDVVYDAATGIITVTWNHLDDNSFSVFKYQGPTGKKVATLRVENDPRNLGKTLVVSITLGDGYVIFIPEALFTQVSGKREIAQAAKATPIEIAVSNDGDAFDTTCDGRLAVVAGANSETPVSLVDLAAGREVSKLAYAGRLARAAAVGDDGRTAVVVFDNPINTNANTIRRLTIGPGDTLADAGEQLSFGTDYVIKVRIAPGSKVGVALVASPARLVSFSLPGLAIKGSLPLGSSLGNGLAMSPAGDKVYARSGNRGIGPDVIEAFTLDPVTGALSPAAAPRISLSFFNGLAYQDPIAISYDGKRLVAADENAAGGPAVMTFSAATGSVIETRRLDPLSQPRTLATRRNCTSTAATQSAVEYYHAAFKHYFVTSNVDEIAKLDNGTFSGWSRTGDRFSVYAQGADGTVPTCRFFSTAFDPKSSHFYAPSSVECTTVKTNPDWAFEGEVFNTAPTTDGTCPPPTLPLYRMYNNGLGGAPNHRYTTRDDVRATMVASGWIPEGLGVGVVACVPP